jgi:hypothetical protein
MTLLRRLYLRSSNPSPPRRRWRLRHRLAHSVIKCVKCWGVS